MQVLLNHPFGSNEASPVLVADVFRFFATRIICIAIIYGFLDLLRSRMKRMKKLKSVDAEFRKTENPLANSQGWDLYPKKGGFVGATNPKFEIVDGSYFLNCRFKKVG